MVWQSLLYSKVNQLYISKFNIIYSVRAQNKTTIINVLFPIFFLLGK